MRISQVVALLVCLGALALGADAAFSQNYPAKPIHVVTTEPGGAGDFVSRIIAQEISGPLGQQVIVDNRPSNLIAETVYKTPPDGYTVLITGNAFWVGPLLQKMIYDPVRDFAPVSLISTSPLILAVHPSLPVKSLRELIALAKSRAGALNYASGGTGAPNHTAAELFKAMAGVDIVRVNYKGGAAAVTAVVGGEVEMTFSTPTPMSSHIKSGRLRALAVTSAQPSALAPDLPTIASSGLPGYETANVNGMFAPAKTPNSVISRLNQEVVRAVSSAEVKNKLLNTGVEVVGGTADQLAIAVKSEITRLEKIFKASGS